MDCSRFITLAKYCLAAYSCFCISPLIPQVVLAKVQRCMLYTKVIPMGEATIVFLCMMLEVITHYCCLDRCLMHIRRDLFYFTTDFIWFVFPFCIGGCRLLWFMLSDSYLVMKPICADNWFLHCRNIFCSDAASTWLGSWAACTFNASSRGIQFKNAIAVYSPCHHANLHVLVPVLFDVSTLSTIC